MCRIGLFAVNEAAEDMPRVLVLLAFAVLVAPLVDGFFSCPLLAAGGLSRW